MPRIATLLFLIKTGVPCILYGYRGKDKINILVWEILEFLREILVRRGSLLESLLKAIVDKLKTDIQVSLGELKFYPADLHSLNILSPAYERNVSSLMALKEGEVLIDIGAHIGRYTIQSAKMVGAEGLIVAVEPECNNFAALLRNIQLNKLNNVIPVENYRLE